MKSNARPGTLPVVGFSIFLAILAFFVLGGAALVPPYYALDWPERWAAGSLLGYVLSAFVLLIAILRLETVTRKTSEKPILAVFILGALLAVSTYAAITDIVFHLFEGVVFTGALAYIDHFISKKASGQEQTRFNNSFYFVDIPQLFGFAVVLVAYFSFPYLTPLQASGTIGDLADYFVSGAFAFNVIAANLTNLFIY